MSADGTGLSLHDGMIEARMSFEDVWVAQLAMGGNDDVMTIEAYILGLLQADDYRHNLIAQAINEQFMEDGRNHPVAYR